MKQYILLYKNQAKEANSKKEDSVKALGGKNYAPNGSNPPLVKANTYTPHPTHMSSSILTPQGTKPFIKAFCPSTPLRDNYPSKNMHMRVLYQKGNITPSQIGDINSNTVNAMNESNGESSKVLKNGNPHEVGMKRFEGLTGGKHTSFN